MKSKNFGKRAFAVGLALSMVVTGSSVNTGTAEAAKKPKLSKTKLKVTAGKTATLQVKNAKKKVKWSTSKKKIVKITETSGKKKEKVTIKGVKKGKAVITAKVGKKKLKCKITVKKQKPNFKKVSVDTYDNECLILKLKKKDKTLQVMDLSVTTKEQGSGSFNHKINVQKIVADGKKQYRVYLQSGIANGQYVQITSGVSKAKTQYKKPFHAEEDEINVYLKKGDTAEFYDADDDEVSLKSYFMNEIGAIKLSVKKGTLPEGLTLDTKTYSIKGVASAAGTSQVTFKAEDELGRTASMKVNFCVYDDTTIAAGNITKEIAWTHTMEENAAAQVAGNASKLDMEKLEDISDCYAQTYTIAPQGGSGNYTFTLDTPDNTDVRLSTDKISDDAAKTVTKKSAASTKLCIPYSITTGTHTYTVTATDVTDSTRTCTSTITVKVVPYYNLSGIVQSNNGLPISGTYVMLIPSKTSCTDDIISVYSHAYDNDGSGYADAEVGVYEAEVPAGTYSIKVRGDVTYQVNKTVKVSKSDKKQNISIPERFYNVNGTAVYSNKANKVLGKTIYFECLNNQYETSYGDFDTVTNDETGNFNIALPANTYVAYIIDEKGNRKYFSKKITVTKKDVSAGTLQATIARYSVEGIAFNGTSVDQQTQFADKLKETTLRFYNDQGICVAKTTTDENGYYKVFLPGDTTYTVKAYFAKAYRTMGTVVVAKENQKDINMTYTAATDVAGAVAYAASPLAENSTISCAGGADALWSFVPAEDGTYSFKVTTAVNQGATVALFDANMQYIDSVTAYNTNDEDESTVVQTEMYGNVLKTGATYYIKVTPFGVRKSGDVDVPQAQGEVKLAIAKSDTSSGSQTSISDSKYVSESGYTTLDTFTVSESGTYSISLSSSNSGYRIAYRLIDDDDNYYYGYGTGNVSDERTLPAGTYTLSAYLYTYDDDDDLVYESGTISYTVKQGTSAAPATPAPYSGTGG